MPATTLSDRAVIRLSGEDVRGFLDGLVTNKVGGELPVWAGLLTPQGKCLFDFLIWADRDDLLLDCEAEAASDLIKRLTIYRLRRPIRIEREEGLVVQWQLAGDWGVPDPRLPELGGRGLSVPAEAGTQSSGGAGVKAATGPLLSQEHNSQDYAWREHRLRLGVCEGRAELADLLWLECNAAELNGVSFTKGCFVGQENTARMNWRQKINRRLMVVEGTEVGPRTRVHYPELGLGVEHRRVDNLGGAIIPEWLAPALAAPTG